MFFAGECELLCVCSPVWVVCDWLWLGDGSCGLGLLRCWVSGMTCVVPGGML